MSLKKTFVLFLFFYACLSSVAQNKIAEYQPGKWQVGGALGFCQYYGDVSNKGYFQKFAGELGYSLSWYGRYHFNNLNGIGLNFHSGKLNSSKDNLSNGDPLYFQFSSGIFNFDVHSYLNISNLFWGSSSTRKMDIYGTAGIGLMFWNSLLTNSLTGEILAQKGMTFPDHTYKTSGAYFPVALGLDYKINQKLSFNFEIAVITVFSDDVDFYNDGFPNDMLSFTSFGLAYRFGEKGKPAAKKTGTTSPNPTGPVKVVDYDLYKSKQAFTTQPIPVLTVEDRKVVENKAFEFRVQVLAKSNKVENVRKFFPHVTFDYDIRENAFGGIYRYSTGSFATFKDAEAYSQTMRSRGISDAFVVAYEKNIRVTITKEMRSK